MPRLLASMPHKFEAVTQQARNVMPETAGVGHRGAAGGGGTQSPPLSVPQVPLAASAQQDGGSMKPGTEGGTQRVFPHATLLAAAAPACAAEGAPAGGTAGEPACTLDGAPARPGAGEPARVGAGEPPRAGAGAPALVGAGAPPRVGVDAPARVVAAAPPLPPRAGLVGDVVVPVVAVVAGTVPRAPVGLPPVAARPWSALSGRPSSAVCVFEQPAAQASRHPTYAPIHPRRRMLMVTRG